MVDVQSNHASEKVTTRVVVPLVPLDDLGRPITHLNPLVRIDDRDYAFIVQSLATLTSGELGDCACSLMSQHGEAFAYALDILFTGF